MPMGKSFARKPAGLKRTRASKKPDRSVMYRKKRRIEESVARSSSPSSEDGSLEEKSSGVTSAEEVVYKEPSVYDDLLKKLSVGRKPLTDAYNRRQRGKQGKSDEEDEDEDEDEEDEDEDEDEEEDGDRDGDEDEDEGDGDGEMSEDTENESEPYDTDQEDAIGVGGQPVDQCTSSFDVHMGKTLSKEDVKNLLKKKLKYEWEVPAADLSNCEWKATGECFRKDVIVNSDCGLKSKLYKHLLDVFKTSEGNDFSSSKQRSFFSFCNSYWDILHCNKKPFYQKGLEEDTSFMDGYIIHCLNHIFRTRDIVIKNDAKLAKHEEIVKEKILTGSLCDSGFTRPKILILLPLASIALRVIKRLIQLTPSGHKVNVEHIDRFTGEFGTVGEDEDKNLLQNADELENLKSQKSSKPSDFQALFAGNNNDRFMIGIKFTRRSIKLYSDFYSSDIIVASPLGLVVKIGEAEEVEGKDVDYLSSIEVLIVDHADVIAMQNWSHVNTVAEKLNHLPSKNYGDITRLKPWYLDGHARFYRQTIVLGSYLNPDINALFNHHCVNYKGKVKSVCKYKGVVPKVRNQVRQIYERFDADSITDVDNARLEYFTKKVFPKIKESSQGGIMLFISSYFEYVRVRNFLRSQNASFCELGEYTKQSDISRARNWFFEGKRKIMLYTERAHFYHRYKIRGIQNLIIYSLPERKEFYPEIVNTREDSDSMTCTALFSRFDIFRLERIVGTTPAKRMVKSEKGVFVFC